MRLLGLVVALVAFLEAAPMRPGAGPERPRRFAQGAAATVRGTVYDSIGGRPLGGATVQLTGRADSVAGRVFSTAADSAGRYSLDAVPPGDYFAGFFHPVLDSLGVELRPAEVSVRRAIHTLPLAIPSARTLARVLCPEGTFDDTLGAIIGHVRETATGRPLAGARVTVEWNEWLIGREGIRERGREVAATANEAGWYGMCALPTEVPLIVHAVIPGPDSATSPGAAIDSSGYVEVTLPQAGLRPVTFLVGDARSLDILARDTAIVATGFPDTTRVSVRRGDARLAGTVVGAQNQPVPESRVAVWGTGRTATTNARGAFSLDSLPGGTHTLEVRSIGYVPVRSIVHLGGPDPAIVRIDLGERTVALPTITVRGQLVYSRSLERFEERRRGAIGYFIPPEEVERRPFIRPTDLLMQVPSVQVRDYPGIGRVVATRSARGGTCTPFFFVDGRRSFLSAAEIDQFYYPHEIAAVEVYARPAMVPAEFQVGVGTCGAVVIWTRPPAARIRERR
jgi:hypothetical protein